MFNLDGVNRSLASISPYPWSFDGVDVVDRNRERVAERKGFQRVGDVNAVFIATAPVVIEQLACEVERLRADADVRERYIAALEPIVRRLREAIRQFSRDTDGAQHPRDFGSAYARLLAVLDV